MELPKPPKTYTNFIKQYPDLGKAWELINQQGKQGPLSEKQGRLIKLAIAIGTKSEGAVHSSVRKALAMGITKEEILQTVALAASSMGMPATVAAYTWVVEEMNKLE